MNHSPVHVTDSTEFLSRSQVAGLFNVAPSTVTRWADEGKLVCVRTLGGHRRYQRESIFELVRKFLKEEDSVETMTIDIPKMYGDHHTSAVHQALAPLAGIKSILASTASRQVQVGFDPAQIQGDAIIAALAEAGYPPRNGYNALAGPSIRKDPAWDKLGLRMTQTYSTAA